MRPDSSAGGSSIAAAIGAILALRALQLGGPNLPPPGFDPTSGYGKCPSCQRRCRPVDLDAMKFRCVKHGPFILKRPDDDPEQKA
jgi:hypothetical protein